MSSAKPRPRWWFLITPHWLAWHAFAVFAAWGMLWLGDWQFHRAEGGNALSWAYTFEWPIFVIFGVIFWGKTIADEFKARKAADQPGGSAEALPLAAYASMSLPAAAHTAASEDVFDDAEDPELAAYNAYLAGLSSGRKSGRFTAGQLGNGQPGSTQPSAG
jgi:TM2 domain-containing membrane protein YozV